MQRNVYFSYIMINLAKYLFLLLLVKETVLIVVKNGGYEDVYIYVQDSNQEDEFILKRIQDVFTEASNFMFTATRQRLYFKKITIVIPNSWTSKPEYKKMPVPLTSKQYIIVNKGGVNGPHVRGLPNCGGEAIYMYLNAEDFLLKQGETIWGLHDHVIVHEWGHLRWGIYDEYPVRDPKYDAFYQADGKWKPVSCIENTEGRTGTGPYCQADKRLCNTDDINKVMDKRCKFCPTETQSLNASLMGYAYINTMSMFCDKNDISVDKGQRHNSRAPSKHNDRCGYRSCWEVMRNHKDFQDGRGLPHSTDTTPEFEIIQGTAIRVFVLDVSGSMEDEGKLNTLRQAVKYVILEVLMQGSWLGIVTFSGTASTIKGLTQINSQTDRDALIRSLPNSADGGTCIGCGIEEAIRILKLKFGNPENAVLVVVSDGENNGGDIQSSTQMAVREKVIVHTLAVTQEADILLTNIAQQTGGTPYTYLQTGSISFAASFSETVTGDPTSAKNQHVMLISEKIDSTPSNLIRFNFTIEEGIGSDTSITVITKSDQVINIELVGPNNVILNRSTSGSYMTLLIPDVAKVGQYEVSISLQQSQQTTEYYVKSTPTREDIVKMSSWLSASQIDFLSDDLPAVFIDVRIGFLPVLNANVYARIEFDNSFCEFTLMDNGIDPDENLNDGIYSRYILPHCLRSGRVNVKGYVKGQAGRTSSTKNVHGAPAVEKVDETPEIFNESFQRVQVLEELYVSNYIDPGTKDIVSPGQITDVSLYNIVSETTQYGESRNFTISWTATGDDKNIGQASAYVVRIADDLQTLLHDFDSADLLEMENTTSTPQEAGMTETLKIVIDAKQIKTKTTFFAVKAVDEAGNVGKVSNIVSIIVATRYRAYGEKGSLDINTVYPPDDVGSGTDKNVIIGGTVGGLGVVLICLLVLLFCRKRRIKKKEPDGGVDLGRV